MTSMLDQIFAPYLWVLMTAWLVTMIVTPCMRRIAIRYGIVDVSDLKRKRHIGSIAYLGGVAILFGWLAGVAISYGIEPHTASDEFRQAIASSSSDGPVISNDTENEILLVEVPVEVPGAISGDVSGAEDILVGRFPMSILIGAVLITLVGVLDDVFDISPAWKLGGQIVAASALVYSEIGMPLSRGILTSLSSGLEMDLTAWAGWASGSLWSDPACWLNILMVTGLVVGGCNSTNLLDGLDGLVSGVIAIVAAGLTFLAASIAMGLYAPEAYLIANDPIRLVACMALLGAVLGFIPHNFHPATIFMGDAGSMLLGYLCVMTILLFGGTGEPESIKLALSALVIFALPVVDTVIAIVRRIGLGQPIWSADHFHLHHQLIRSGFSVRQTVGMLYLIALGCLFVGCSIMVMRFRYLICFFFVAMGFLVIMSYKIGCRQYLAEQQDASEPVDEPIPFEGAATKQVAEAVEPSMDRVA